MSRLDRIYVHQEMYETTREWKTFEPSRITTAHHLVSATFYDLEAPYLGTRRWQIPSFLLKHEKFLEFVHQECATAIKQMEEHERTKMGPHDPQATFSKLKTSIVQEAKRLRKAMIPRAKKKVRKLTKDLDAVLNDPAKSDAKKTTEAKKIEERILEIETAHQDNRRQESHTTSALENERIGRAWIQANKEKKPRDTIPMLIDQNDPRAEPITQSEDMAKHAQDYHESLQHNVEQEPESRLQAIDKVLSKMEQGLDEDNARTLSTKLERDKIHAAPQTMPNGKASGMDGIPAELWKDMAKAYSNAVKDKTPENKRPPDIVKMLKMLFNYIEENRVRPDGNFAIGWMCPIYKKKDRSNIANYRPITVLNADYKVFTKALTIRLAPIALKIIHPDQAGFMKGRRINDHTELIKVMIEWCDIEQE